LILRIAPAVAKAAMDTGVAKRPIGDFALYEETLSGFVFRSGFVMKPVIQAAKACPKRVIYAEGEDERVLRATQTVVEEGIAKPILVGRPEAIKTRIERFGLAVRRVRISNLSIQMTIRAIAIMSRPISMRRDGGGSRPRPHGPWCGPIRR
jgi:Phosphotransacetylase